MVTVEEMRAAYDDLMEKDRALHEADKKRLSALQAKDAKLGAEDLGFAGDLSPKEIQDRIKVIMAVREDAAKKAEAEFKEAQFRYRQAGMKVDCLKQLAAIEQWTLKTIQQV